MTSRQSRDPLSFTALRSWWPVAAVVLLVALVAVAAANASVGVRDVAPLPPGTPDVIDAMPTPTRATPSTIELPADESGMVLPAGVVTAIKVVGGVLVIGIVLALLVAVVRDRLRVRERRAGSARRRTDAAQEVVAAVDAGLQELATDRDPRGAVITCWVRLELAAAAAGTRRQPGDTPTDLVARLLHEQHVDAEVLAGFADVYREARYATHVVDERMRAQAVDALHRLRADLTAAAAA